MFSSCEGRTLAWLKSGNVSVGKKRKWCQEGLEVETWRSSNASYPPARPWCLQAPRLGLSRKESTWLHPSPLEEELKFCFLRCSSGDAGSNLAFLLTLRAENSSLVARQVASADLICSDPKIITHVEPAATVVDVIRGCLTRLSDFVSR